MILTSLGVVSPYARARSPALVAMFAASSAAAASSAIIDAASKITEATDTAIAWHTLASSSEETSLRPRSNSERYPGLTFANAANCRRVKPLFVRYSFSVAPNA